MVSPTGTNPGSVAIAAPSSHCANAYSQRFDPVTSSNPWGNVIADGDAAVSTAYGDAAWAAATSLTARSMCEYEVVVNSRLGCQCLGFQPAPPLAPLQLPLLCSLLTVARSNRVSRRPPRGQGHRADRRLSAAA